MRRLPPVSWLASPTMGLVALGFFASTHDPGAATAPRPAPAGAVHASARTVPFIADDYARAVAEARARKVPLFIEAWAPW